MTNEELPRQTAQLAPDRAMVRRREKKRFRLDPACHSLPVMIRTGIHCQALG